VNVPEEGSWLTTSAPANATLLRGRSGGLGPEWPHALAVPADDEGDRLESSIEDTIDLNLPQRAICPQLDLGFP